VRRQTLNHAVAACNPHTKHPQTTHTPTRTHCWTHALHCAIMLCQFY